MDDMPTVYSAFLEHPLSVRLSVHYLQVTGNVSNLAEGWRGVSSPQCT